MEKSASSSATTMENQNLAKSTIYIQ